ncbi:PhoX family phosphatase [Yinghuangia sp. ASG 101]|uniref:PhoX family protein n=1 Tax=Yinghuangia sp. ASG 101 TaxID=2896848 RepID=UPI001E44AD89|nr:PhoX family phosphatase [Yinghuangia sp. ASG 101]UGQ11571.1 PhoX family phosphatase [Yinghuangia sp. ASG 101]
MPFDHVPSHDPDDVAANPSGNRTLGEVVASRRSVLRGSTVAAAGFLAGGGLLAGAGAAGAQGEDKGRGRPGGKPSALLGFAAVATSDQDRLVVPPGYTADILVPWGTPLSSRGPAWRKDASNSAADQARQVGMNHDGMHFFPTGRGSERDRRGVLVVNHEYVDQALLFPDGPAVMTREKVDKALAAHGVTVVEVAEERGRWKAVDSRLNRRVTGATPVRFSGPVGDGHPALAARGPARGTLNNCSNGATPWGTYLACEENWNSYFATDDATWTPSPEQARYGVDKVGSGYNWHKADPRFDIAADPNEANRFGWVVEIDPFDPRSTPVKRTALGRVKHEGATVTESRGRVVVYTGDDQDKEYVYKFVGDASWRSLRARGESPLDHGTLHVAKFEADGSGRWLPLVFGTGPLTAANGWRDQADVLLRTRQAADAVGATPLDRPEWIAVHPRSKDVFVTLTNGSGGGPVGPRTPNPYGQIVRWREDRGDNTALTFRWDIFLLAGDPKYDAKVTLPEDRIFGSPDGLAVDDDGRLWIQTDISNSSQNQAGKGYDRIGNNQMLAADPSTGEVRRFLTGPRGCEITGITFTPDHRTMFVNIQHPGESTTVWGAPSPADPRAVSNWPDFDPAGRPRSATVVIRKRDGGVIGT